MLRNSTLHFFLKWLARNSSKMIRVRTESLSISETRNCLLSARNPALPIVPVRTIILSSLTERGKRCFFFFLQTASVRIQHAAYVLKTCILSKAPQMIRDRKYHLKMHRSCLVGSEMVDWLIHQSPSEFFLRLIGVRHSFVAVVHSRSQAVGMWQALLEEAAIAHGR